MHSRINEGNGAVETGKVAVVNSILVAEKTKKAVIIRHGLYLIHQRRRSYPSQYRLLSCIIINKNIMIKVKVFWRYNRIKTQGIIIAVGTENDFA